MIDDGHNLLTAALAVLMFYSGRIRRFGPRRGRNLQAYISVVGTGTLAPILLHSTETVVPTTVIKPKYGELKSLTRNTLRRGEHGMLDWVKQQTKGRAAERFLQRGDLSSLSCLRLLLID